MENFKNIGFLLQIEKLKYNGGRNFLVAGKRRGWTKFEKRGRGGEGW